MLLFRALDEARALLALVRGAEIPNTDRPTWESLRVLHGAYFTDPDDTLWELYAWLDGGPGDYHDEQP